MKKKLKSIAISAILLFTLLTSCSKDEIQNTVVTHPKSISQRVSVNQVLSEINNPLIKNYINDELTLELGLAEFRTTSEQYINFIKIIKENGYTTYSFLIQEYSQENPYFKYFIITKDGGTEKAGYVKYIPDNPINKLDIRNFTGRIQVIDLLSDIISETQFINSTPQPQTQGLNCSSSVSINVFNCTHGGNHPPGTNCSDGYTNDGYWEIVVTTTCIWTNIVNYIAAPDAFMGDPSGGGAITYNPEVIVFLNLLTPDKLDLIINNPNLITYLESNINTSPVESKAFVTELLQLAVNESSLEDVNKLINFVLEAKIQDKIYNDLDQSFLLSVDQYMDLDVANYIDPTNPLWMHFSIQCAVLRANHPDWNDLKIYWEASKEMLHITLDVLGLIPVVGEVADLTNGVLYTIEGDGVNATLSYASAVPIAGWAAVSTKYAIKVIDASQTATTIATKVKLVWKVTANGIDFGHSGQLRKVLGITASNIQAHHLIPWSSRTKTVVQRAAKSGNAFHMNESLNGIAVAAWRNQPNHQAYNNLIDSKIDDYFLSNPNATPNQCYTFLTDLLDDARTWVVNNPNSHLNELVLP